MTVDFEALDLIRTQNRAEMHERKKIEFLEDRIKVLEKTLESHAKILARFQMTENNEPDFVHSQGFSLKERS
jgi:hypothetical protein